MFGRRSSQKNSSQQVRRNSFQFETLEERTVFSASAIGSPAPVEEVVQTYAGDTVAPLAELLSVEEWVRSLSYNQFALLDGTNAQYLTTQQIASIPDSGWFATLSDNARGSLNQLQIQAINTSKVRVYSLNQQQLSWLTAPQIRALSLLDFKYLTPSQIQLLTPQQIATIPDPGPFSEWTTAARAALTQPQVQALNVAKVRIGQLTPQQVSWLTAAQVQSLQVLDFQYLSPSQIPSLTTQQIASIPDPGPLSAWTSAARAALTINQVQAINVAKVRLYLLTPTQISWLSAAQIRSIDFTTTDLAVLNSQQISLITDAQIKTLKFNYFYLLSASQTPQLTGAQLSTIPNRGYFSAWSPAARAALTTQQVQTLNVASVNLDLLSPQQLAWITVSQVKSLTYVDFQYVNANLVGYLTPTQISSIPNADWFAAWAPNARAALGLEQTQALNVASVHMNLLTQQQLGWITADQVRSLGLFDFQYVNPFLVPLLTTAQIALIPDPGPFITWAANARAALTATQIAALNVAKVRLDLLTPQQVAWLTTTQIQSLGISDFKYLSASQTPRLTTAQLASIPNPGPLSEWTAAARAALTMEQIRALNVANVRINLLTPQQTSWLTTPQIQSLKLSDFSFLNPGQIPQLTTTQIASIPDPGPLSAWSSSAVAALTQQQVRALNVANVRITLLTRQQISWLTQSQVQSLKVWDVALLWDSQIPWVTPQQFSQMTSRDIIDGFSDAVRASLSREQLLALPYYLMPGEDTQTPPSGYTPAVDIPVGSDGIQDLAHMDAEAETVFNLVPYSAVTHTAIYSGNWSDPNVWKDRIVPAAGANVLIAAGATVRFDVYQNTALKTLRIDGELTFATNVNTQLKADTIIVFTTGKLHIGTAAAPIADNVTARILIADAGPINTAWDPYLWSRGIVSRGEVRVFGKAVTSQVELAVDPKAGDRTLYLSEAPVGWKVGDELAIAGVNQYSSDFGTDRVRILAINGKVVTVDALRYSHDAPDGLGLSINVANLTRNVQFTAEDSSVIAERPHLAFIHNPNVIISGLGVYGFGRTDKTQEINSPVVVNGVLVPGTGTNPRARYAMHFHHTGVGPDSMAAIVQDSVVDGSPGWGFVNHSSKVIFEYNVAYGAVGSGFATEDGNEVGAMRYNISMQSTGSDDFLLERRANHDFGHGGHGFWFQGPGIQVVGNIAAANAGAGFAYITSSSKNLFDAVNLDDPSLAAGRKAVPVGTVPLKEFRGNTAYSSQKGLDLWFHLLQMTDGDTVIEDFTSWNTELYGIDLSYSGRITVLNSRLYGDLNTYNGYGVFSNRMTHDITLLDVQAEGFLYGVYVPPRGTTNIVGGRFGNIRNIYIVKAHDTNRAVNLSGAMQFVNLTSAQLRGRTLYNFYLTGEFYLNDFQNRKLESLFSADPITVNIVGMPKMMLQYFEQGSAFTPFPAMDGEGMTPAGYVGKTNAQLRSAFGISFGGGFVSPSAVLQPRLYGYAIPVN